MINAYLSLYIYMYIYIYMFIDSVSVANFQLRIPVANFQLPPGPLLRPPRRPGAPP